MDLSHMVCVMVALLVFVTTTESCMCAREKSLRQYYCESDFAVKATVSNWTVNYESPSAESTYTLHILQAFKLPANLRNETEVVVHSVSDGLCGINPGQFYPGRSHKRRYFITGFMTEDGTLFSMLCRNTYRSWRFLTRKEKRNIRNMENLTC